MILEAGTFLLANNSKSTISLIQQLVQSDH